MATMYASVASTAIDPTQYSIGRGTLYTEKVYNFLNSWKYGNGLYSKSVIFKDASLIKNPLHTRYQNNENTVFNDGGYFIGQKANVYTQLGRQIVFLDDVGGLSGFTYNKGYEEVLGTTALAHMEGLKHNMTDGPLQKNIEDIDLYDTSTKTKAKTSLSNDEYEKLNILKFDKRLDVVSSNFNHSLYIMPHEKIGINSYIIQEGEYDWINVLYGRENEDTYAVKSIDSPSFSSSGWGETRKNNEDYLYSENNTGDNEHLTFADKEVSEFGDVIGIGGTSSNGLLRETRSLFSTGKIKSMINRFSLPNKEGGERNMLQTSVDDKNGISKGRNLRKVDNTVLHINGYDKPFCRTWTSHYQYSKLKHLVKPFTDVDEQKFYTIDELQKNLGEFRPNDGVTRLSNFTSMQPNGLVRIAPHVKNGELNKDEIKKCMFSIENLAWKDINFKASVDGSAIPVLTESQRGENGGRIMWFPPYNLDFSENVGVNWEESSFIGRGESLFTYNNTKRSGTLNFTILVDHPSMVDKWARNENNKEKEDVLLRFYAGEELLTYPEPEKAVIEPEEVKPEPPVEPEPEKEPEEYKFFVFFPNNFSGEDYENPDDVMGYLDKGYGYTGSTKSEDIGGYEFDGENLMGCMKEKFIKGKYRTWYYEVDNACKDQLNSGIDSNNHDANSYGLNVNLRTILVDDENKDTVRTALNINTDISKEEIKNTIFTFYDLYNKDEIFNILKDKNDYDVKIEIDGYASKIGKKSVNRVLSLGRANSVARWIKKKNYTDDSNITVISKGEYPIEGTDINSLSHKLGRRVDITIKLTPKETITPQVDVETGHTATVENNQQKDDLSKTKGQTKASNTQVNTLSTTITNNTDDCADNEYVYFNTLDENSPMIRKNIVEKIRYFDPAYHSITPEGFNARLTFLHQCTRQGPTIGTSDNGNYAGNLAFGRPPVCVLRIGDFYNTKIIIDSLNIDYKTDNGISWDMNPEGIGLQPMMANISMNIKFLGGSDLSGPIARLQNAVSYNFFANTSVYDRRADYRTEDDNINKVRAWNPTFTGDENNNTTKHTEYTFN